MHFFRRPLPVSLLTVSAFLVWSCGRHSIAPVDHESDPTGTIGAERTAPNWADPTLRDEMDLLARPRSESGIPIRRIIDDEPAWSPDGHSIAFHRRFASSYGPPGLYLVSAHGGTPRLLIPGGFGFPREVSFAPDGNRLVCDVGNRLAIIDLVSGEVSRPFFTDNGAAFPDWSPDGHSIVYSRIFRTNYPPEPLDSVGLHVFDTKSLTDRVLKYQGNVLGSGPVRWIHGGEAVGFVYGLASSQQLSIATLDGQQLIDLYTVPNPVLLWHLQKTGGPGGGRAQHKTEALVVLLIDRDIRTLQFTTGPVAMTERRPLGLWDALSSDGDQGAFVRPDPRDSLGVLFVGRADGPSRAPLKQLTRFDPP